MIIAGDCGLLWETKPSPKEISLYIWFAHQSFTTLFVDGNHENFNRINALPIADYIGWWPEEIFNEKEKQNAYDNLQKENYELDYVITHAGPKRVVLDHPRHMKIYDEPCPVEDFLDELYEKIKFRYWYFGHYHYNYDDDLNRCYWLYQQITKLE